MLQSTTPLILAAIALMAALLVGCEKQSEPVALPEVNDESCKTENLMKLEKSVRQEFATLCALRGDFKPSKPKSW